MPKRNRLSELPGMREAFDRLVGTPDVFADYRNFASVLAALKHPSPERTALLASIGLNESALSGRLCEVEARYVLRQIEHLQAATEFDCSWSKRPYPSRDEAPPTSGVNAKRMSDVVSREIEWQATGITALGKYTHMSGPPCAGKTMLACDLSASVTVARPFAGMALGHSQRRNVLFVTAEDDAADTLRPRIELLGGDPSRVHVLDFVFDAKAKSENWLALDKHLEELRQWLRAHPLVELVVLDPISAMLGRVDSHRDADVRRVMGPLAKLAEQCRVAIVGIAHLNKATEGSAMNRSMGSIAFVAAARIAWQVTADANEPGRSLFLPVKCNIGPRPKGRAFRILGNGALEWEPGEVTVTADEAVNARSLNKTETAAEFLRDILKDKPQPANDVTAKAEAAGIADRTLDEAKAQLGVVSTRVGGRNGAWVWSLPQPTNAK